MSFLISETSPQSRILKPGNGRALISLKNVNKVFKLGSGEFQALNNINLDFHQGDYAAIMGKSGSGKSTLINMITGIDTPTSGIIQVDEVELNRMTQAEMAVWRGPNLGIVFQFFQLLPMLTVLENTMLPMDFTNQIPFDQREKRAMSLLDMVGLVEVSDKLPVALSGGQQQAAAIARALANDPPILVADEPTGNLDSRTAERILTIFEDLAMQGKTILIVTHDSSLAERASRRIFISDGKLINEHLVKALPNMPHSTLAEITHQLAERNYLPGIPIARQGATDAGFFLITQGKIEIVRRCDRGDQEKIGEIGPGEYFSILEILETPSCDLCFLSGREANTRLLYLNTETFYQIMAGDLNFSETLKSQAKQRSQKYCPRLQLNPFRRR